jgi:2-oxoglutarate dehydrogenase E1 component
MSLQSAELQSSELQSLEGERVFDAFRRWGYLDANLDPFGGPIAGGYPEIRLHGEAAEAARRIYCGSIGAEFMHLPQPDRRKWVQEQMENPQTHAVDRRWLAERLLQADLFEQILQTRYLGTKRYSGEGATALIPMLDTILETGAGLGANASVMAMSHRGRLTVMSLIIGIPPENVFAGFEDVDPRSVLGGGAGSHPGQAARCRGRWSPAGAPGNHAR